MTSKDDLMAYPGFEMLQIPVYILHHARTIFHLDLILLALLIYLILSYHFQSPLYRFPGPLVVSFTNLYRLLDVWRRAPQLTLLSLHMQYGDTVRLGPTTLSFSNPDALGEIYGLKANFHKVRWPLERYCCGIEMENNVISLC